MIGASLNAAFGDIIKLPAYEFNSISIASDSPLSLGFWFKTNQAVVITDLGYFDDGGDGFGVPHNVGLFDPSGALLAFTTLGAGTIDPLDGHFRYRPITPIELPGESWYVIAATTGGPTDAWGYGHPYDINGLSISPFISVPSHAASFVYQCGNTLRFPTEQFGYQIYSGPNMLLAAPADVPEPGTIALIVVGAIALGLCGFHNTGNHGLLGGPWRVHRTCEEMPRRAQR
jgi:hypothetical protein